MPIYDVTSHGVPYQIYAEGQSPSIDRMLKQGVPYEQRMLDHIYRQRYSGTVIDVGANIGNHTLFFAMVCRLDVIAFEPVFGLQLRGNIDRNAINTKVTVHAVGLGERDGRAEHVGPHGRLSVGATGIHPIRRLDGYELPEISMIKIDVEGMEADVLKGATDLLKRDTPDIYAEEWDDHPHWHDDIAKVLEPLGYEMVLRFSGRRAWTPVGVWKAH